MAIPGAWDAPQPAQSCDIGHGQSVPPRCGRCKTKGDSPADGRLMTYPAGNFHERCAEREQADDDRFARVRGGDDPPPREEVTRDASGAIERGPSLACGCPLDAGCTGYHPGRL